MANSLKIINDPLYGFITINDPLILSLINHPYFQRLKRVQQMALASTVYPGATHTRFQHSLGAYHLMHLALDNLKKRGIEITPQEEQAAKIAILLHDIGHGPFSHALEKHLLINIHHENVSLLIMETLNKQFNNQLLTAISIFKNTYPKKFLYQLISGQLDVDRMDYLMRDSFYTGVSEGVIGYDRILKMLHVINNNIVVEEKGIISIEKFLIARQHMFWQVYRHKTVLAAEKMLVKIIERAKFLIQQKKYIIRINSNVDFFLNNQHVLKLNQSLLNKFVELDDNDILYAIKKWAKHPDFILSTLCTNLLNRKLYTCIIQNKKIPISYINQKNIALKNKFNLNDSDIPFFSFQDLFNHQLYNGKKTPINFLLKNGSIKEISSLENTLINKTVAVPIKKYFYCYFNF